MRCNIKIFLYAIVLMAITSGPAAVSAQSIPQASGPGIDCEGSARAYAAQGIPCRCEYGRIVCDQPSGGRSSGKKHNINQEIKMQVVGTIFESLLTSLFMDNTANEKQALAAKQKAAALAAQQAVAIQRAKDIAAQAEYEKMMRSYKQLDGSQGVAFKTLSDSTLGFKTLDGDAETLAASARKPFDTPPEMKAPGSETLGGGTAFFGDTMPIQDIQLLVNPENDPNVVDLRNANAYVVENLKKDSQKLAAATKPEEEKGNDKPGPRSPECAHLSKKLDGFITQRKQFQKTIDLAQTQLNTWQDANRNALLNAAKDGLEYFTGQLMDGFTRRSQAADRLQRIYAKNAKQMAQEGLNIADIEAKIKRLRMLSSAGKLKELAGNINDWQTFIKDGVSGLMVQLTASNQEIEQMLADPRMQKYFEMETPALKALLDISMIAASSKVFGKWVAKKVPIIAGVQLAINQIYNATDWFLSYQQIVAANKINGEVLYAARSIQDNINDTYLALRDCH